MCLHGYIPQFDGWRLSLGGTSVAGLAHFLGRYPQISHCLVCTDVDEAGDKAAARISEMTGIKIERVTPPIGVDWNDALLALQKAERTQNRARNSARHERG
jgi:DNA primase